MPRIRVRRETELHGRAEDLVALREAWARARQGSGNTVWIGVPTETEDQKADSSGGRS